MQTSFNIYTPTSVNFGSGIAQEIASVLPDGTDEVLVVRGASGVAARPLIEKLESRGIVVHQVSVSGEPSVGSVNSSVQGLADKQKMPIIACGGGSVIDTAKAIRCCIELGSALPTDIDSLDQRALNVKPSSVLIAVPTTAGTGAEVTNNAVLATNSLKKSIRGELLFPSVALVDPTLPQSAPGKITIGAGLDAITQTIEAYTSRISSPFTVAITESNIEIGVKALKKLSVSDDTDAWAQIAWVSLSSGLALSNGGLGAAHGLASVLGGQLKAPHGLLCGRLLGPVLLKNRSLVEVGSVAFRRIERCVEILADAFPPRKEDRVLSGFEAWLNQHHVPRLRDYSVDTAHYDEFSEAAVFASSSTKNAVPLKMSDFRDVLNAAY